MCLKYLNFWGFLLFVCILLVTWPVSAEFVKWFIARDVFEGGKTFWRIVQSSLFALIAVWLAACWCDLAEKTLYNKHCWKPNLLKAYVTHTHGWNSEDDWLMLCWRDVCEKSFNLCLNDVFPRFPKLCETSFS